MASTYPTTLDTLATTRADNTPNVGTQAADHDNYADAINKIEIELGTLPKGTDATVKARLDRVDAPVSTNSQAGTTYTLILTDTDKILELTNAGAVTVTVPPNSSVAFLTGATVGVFRYGAGEVTVAPGAGVTIRSPGAALRVNAQYSGAVLRKRATDEWVFEGDIKV